MHFEILNSEHSKRPHQDKHGCLSAIRLSPCYGVKFCQKKIC